VHRNSMLAMMTDDSVLSLSFQHTQCVCVCVCVCVSICVFVCVFADPYRYQNF